VAVSSVNRSIARELLLTSAKAINDGFKFDAGYASNTGVAVW